MKKNEHGFGAIEALLVVVIIAIVGFAGWWVYKSKNATNKTLSDTSQSVGEPSKATKSSSTPAPQAVRVNYLTIKEWGVKVKLGSADSSIVEYALDNTVQKGDSALGEGDIYGTATLSLKDAVTTDPSCKKLGIAIQRVTLTSADSKSVSSKYIVGKYKFGVTGSPASCGNAKLDATRKNYTGNNPGTWEYTAL